MSNLLKKSLLVCGILSPLIYIASDIFVASRWPDYSFIDQTIGELSAIGAPTRALWIYLTFITNPLLIAFGIGVFQSSSQKSLRWVGILLTLWGFLGFVWYFFPMNLRGSIGSTTDTMHLVMAAVTVLLMTTFIAIGSGSLGFLFRLYSILTLVAMLSFGALTGVQAPRVAAHLPTPGLGILERVSVYSPMIWMAVLSLILLYRPKSYRRKV